MEYTIDDIQDAIDKQYLSFLKRIIRSWPENYKNNNYIISDFNDFNKLIIKFPNINEINNTNIEFLRLLLTTIDLTNKDILKILTYDILKLDNIDLYKVLVENPYFNPNIKIYNGKTPLMYIIRYFNDKNKYESIKLTLNHKDTDPNIQDEYFSYYTAFHYAIVEKYGTNYIDIIKLFLEDKRLNINIKNENGNTALHLSLLQDIPKVSYIILSKQDLDLSIKNCNNHTPLFIVIDKTIDNYSRSDNKMIIYKIINHLNFTNNEGTSLINQKLIRGRTVLFNDDLFILKMLLSVDDIDINVVDFFGNKTTSDLHNLHGLGNASRKLSIINLYFKFQEFIYENNIMEILKTHIPISDQSSIKVSDIKELISLVKLI